MASLRRILKRQLDAFIYGLIGPFSVLYLFPRFFLDIENQLGVNFEAVFILKWIGIILMNFGGVLAIWCAIIMYISKKATPSPFSTPQKVVTNGPYKYVRHPMMWSLNFVIIGQVLVWSSPFVFVWFLIWIRFSIIYVAKYEEPYLISLFGKEYLDYCKNTPRWIPRVLIKN